MWQKQSVTDFGRFLKRLLWKSKMNLLSLLIKRIIFISLRKRWIFFCLSKDLLGTEIVTSRDTNCASRAVSRALSQCTGHNKTQLSGFLHLLHFYCLIQLIAIEDLIFKGMLCDAKYYTGTVRYISLTFALVEYKHQTLWMVNLLLIVMKWAL